ncbi:MULTISPECIES: AAA family ATPase [unclassified Nocardia]|uniref:AAA family ATPase n=1 Tax=unclassified Nocardia TaxID=2637762 RepID=UPI00278C04AB|nr:MULTISPECIES: AAA family ATPase [unclassified Nocardia]
MNPPLESGPLHLSPDPRSMAPFEVHDLRGHPIRELRYPATAAVIVTGVPGAGKSTALRRLFGCSSDAVRPAAGPDGTVLLDSQHARNWWQQYLRAVPYPLWLPIVHVTHYLRIRAALHRADGPVVIHDCGTRQWVRHLVALWARAAGRQVHMIMIDAPAEQALAGQVSRGREVSGLSFRMHCAKWRRLVDAVAAGTKPRPEPASVVILDRRTVTELREVSFAA